jgi:hypothetical protein
MMPACQPMHLQCRIFNPSMPCQSSLTICRNSSQRIHTHDACLSAYAYRIARVNHPQMQCLQCINVVPDIHFFSTFYPTNSSSDSSGSTEAFLRLVLHCCIRTMEKLERLLCKVTHQVRFILVPSAIFP